MCSEVFYRPTQEAVGALLFMLIKVKITDEENFINDSPRAAGWSNVASLHHSSCKRLLSVLYFSVNWYVFWF